jgi:hypothetical protein
MCPSPVFNDLQGKIYHIPTDFPRIICIGLQLFLDTPDFAATIAKSWRGRYGIARMRKGTMTAREFAQQMGAAYTTVMLWLHRGLIPGAKLKEDQRGPYWEIPVSALKTFRRPKIGRPKKLKKEQ